MPTYEYACRACSERLEVVQSFRDDPLTECPSCGGQLRKVFQPVGISFKGSGFYKNDSREAAKAGAKSQSSSSGSSDSGSSDGSSSDGGGSKAESSSSESKPASVTGSKAGESSGTSGSSSASSPQKSSSPASS